MKLNILLSAGYISKDHFANLNIITTLAKELQKRGHQCYIVGLSHEEGYQKNFENGVELYSLTTSKIFNKALLSLKKFYKKGRTQKQFAFTHPIKTAIILISRSKIFRKLDDKIYNKLIQKFIINKNIQSIVMFSYPFYLVNCIDLTNFKGCKIHYQLDPFSLHIINQNNNLKQKISQEVELIQRINYLVTTKLLANEYCNHNNFKQFREKIIAADFPALIKKEDLEVKSAFDFDKNYINLLYCGTLYSKFRSPEFVLNTLKPILVKHKNIRVYFLGTVKIKEIKIIDSDIQNQIFIHSAVNNDIANKTMKEADVLINIGNNIYNMIPSKIFDYFSTGKPIINAENLKECPARKYFEMYPISCTINEHLKVDTEILEQFILDSKNKQVPYEVIEKTYITATPKYVANQLEDLIRSI